MVKVAGAGGDALRKPRVSDIFANPANVLFIPRGTLQHSGTSRVRFPILILPLFLAACATDIEPTQSELRAKWDVQNVFPANYKADVTAFMQTYLNNPANIRNAAITRPQVRRVPGDPGDRYMVCLRYNARKSDGGYAGMTGAVVTFVAGKFERFIDPQRGDLQRQTAAGVVQELCKDAAFEPFPELQHLRR